MTPYHMMWGSHMDMEQLSLERVDQIVQEVFSFSNLSESERLYGISYFTLGRGKINLLSS